MTSPEPATGQPCEPEVVIGPPIPAPVGLDPVAFGVGLELDHESSSDTE